MAVTAERLPVRMPGEHGVWSWITTVDHKRIGLLYAVTAFLFFFIGGLEALLVRIQLAQPNGEVLSADAYNQLFTMHGLTMVFLVVMPIAAAFTNYFLPILLGARDVAFPRLNAFSYWLFLFSGIMIYTSFFVGGAPDGAWVGYSPLATQITEVVRMDYWAIGLNLLGIASIASSANFIATIFTMRAPGMTMLRMPVFVWMSLVVAFLLIFSLPPVTIGLFQLFLDRNFGALFYEAAAGGDPLLWQHLFWLFGHPEVYVLILPAMGIVSEILPVFSRKPLFGYEFVVFSRRRDRVRRVRRVVAPHVHVRHGPGRRGRVSAIATMIIAVPTGVKIFNWIGTTWGGRLRFQTPMLFSLGFIAMFVIGGLSGVTHAIVPADTQQHDSYYVVAHFHYVLFGGAIFGYVAGVYYWFPKWTGRMLNERLRQAPLLADAHRLQPDVRSDAHPRPQRHAAPHLSLRRRARLGLLEPDGDDRGVHHRRCRSSSSSTTSFASRKHGAIAGNDPWDGRTLEWTISSPPPVHNFDEVPVVQSLDDFWHKKYAEDEEGRLVEMATVTGGTLVGDRRRG